MEKNTQDIHTIQQLLLELNETKQENRQLRQSLSECQENEAYLRLMNERYKMLLELTSDYFFQMRVDETHGVVMDFVTKGFTDVLGYTLEEMDIPAKWRKRMLFPEDIPMVERLTKEALSNKWGILELRCKAKNGKVKWIRIHKRPLLDDSGKKVIGVVGAGTDITEKKQLEEEQEKTEMELRALNEQLESFYSTAHVKIAYMDREFNFIRVNKAYADAAGHPPAYFIGKNHFELYPNRENEDIFQQVVETGKPYTTQARPFEYVDQPDLKLTYWDWTLDPILKKDGTIKGVVLCLIDVTKQEVYKNRLEEQKKQVILADRLRTLGEVTAGIMHELKQPVMGIRNIAEHLGISVKKGWALEPGNVSEKAQSIVEQIDRISHVMEHARLFARGGDAKILKQPTCLNSVVNDAVILVHSQLRSHGIQLKLELAPEIPKVLGNPFSLEEVVINLVKNARDAVLERMQKDDGTKEPTINLQTLTEQSDLGECIKLQVSDEGIGMSKDLLEKIFDPFFSTKDPSFGTGLGLPICQSIVRKFQGQIEISSEQDKGTIVSVILPAMQLNIKQPTDTLPD